MKSNESDCQVQRVRVNRALFHYSHIDSSNQSTNTVDNVHNICSELVVWRRKLNSYDIKPFVYSSIDNASDNRVPRNTCSNTPHTFRNT